MKQLATVALILTSAMFGFFQGANSQTAKDIFNSTDMPVTYLGVDFTEARLINDAAAVASDLKERHFPGINQVVINEPKKYDLAKAFKKTINNDISVTEKVNSTIDEEK